MRWRLGSYMIPYECYDAFMICLWCYVNIMCILCIYICLLNVWFLVFVNYTNHKYRWVPHLKPTFAQPPGDSCGGKLAGPKTELVSEDSQEKKKKLWKGHCNLARPKNLFVALSEQILSFGCIMLRLHVYKYIPLSVWCGEDKAVGRGSRFNATKDLSWKSAGKLP